MKRHVLALALVVASVVAPAVSAGAYPGDLDPSFGQGGAVALSPTVGEAVGRGVVLQGDGKLDVAVEQASNAFVVRRFLSDGSSDTAFGSWGTATAQNTARADTAAEALQPDGKIVVVGDVFVPNCAPSTSPGCPEPHGTIEAFGLARFTSAGTLDPAFGSADNGFPGVSAGTVTTLFDGRNGGAEAVAIQPDGKMVAAGTADDGTAHQIAVVRYNPDGTRDTSFGTAGTLITRVGAGSSASSVLIQPDGKLVVAGYTSDPTGTNGQFALVRYNPDGTLDTRFGTGGMLTTAIGTRAAVAGAALLPDGRIVAAGWARAANTSSSEFALARYNADGTLDNGFGSRGIVTTSVGTSSTASSVLLQPDGTILAAGSTSGPNSSQKTALVLYSAKGALDAGFGQGGIVTAVAPNSPGDWADAVTMQPDGRLVVAGTSVMRFDASQGGTAVHTHVTMKAPKKVTYGQSIKYTVTVANTGATDAHGVAVRVTLPPGADTRNVTMTPANCTVVNLDSAVAGETDVVCNLGTLAHKTSATVTVTARPLHASSTTLKNMASDSTTDREMSPATSTHAKAAVKVVCPQQGSCNTK